MRLHINFSRPVMLGLTGVAICAMGLGLNHDTIKDGEAIGGTWADYADTSWADVADGRYEGYAAEAGSSADTPFLIEGAAEFSGLRVFEGTQDLAGKYLKLAGSIDLSAHYWDPIELYGAGNPLEDWSSDQFLGALIGDEVMWTLTPDDELVHFDGGGAKITGLNILDTYDEVTVARIAVEGDGGGVSNFESALDEGLMSKAGATGLFSYAYKARISNLTLESPSIVLEETSGIGTFGMMGDGRIDVSDLVGTVAGALQDAQLIGVNVFNPTISYSAVFNEPLGEVMVGDVTVDAYYGANNIVVGGAAGYSTLQSVLKDVLVKGGEIDMRPTVETASTANIEEVIAALNMVTTGGLVGYNFYSTILNTCSSADIVFSDENYLFEGQAELDTTDANLLVFGGLAGVSTSILPLFTCIYNSCANGDITVDAQPERLVLAGGITGLLLEDSMVNTYFGGNIDVGEGVEIGLGADLPPELEGVGSVLDGIINTRTAGELAGMLVSITNRYTIANNYYFAGGLQPFGGGLMVAPQGNMAMTIVNQDRLLEDLNAGRELVLADMRSHVADGSIFPDSYVMEWGLQDGSGAMDCADGLTVGLKFAGTSEGGSIGAPDTGRA